MPNALGIQKNSVEQVAIYFVSDIECFPAVKQEGDVQFQGFALLSE